MELNSNTGEATVRVQNAMLKGKTFGDSESLLTRNRSKKAPRRWESDRCGHSFQEEKRKTSESNNASMWYLSLTQPHTDLETDDLWLLRHESNAQRGASLKALRPKPCSANFRSHNYLESARHLMVPYDILETQESDDIRDWYIHTDPTVVFRAERNWS